MLYSLINNNIFNLSKNIFSFSTVSSCHKILGINKNASGSQIKKKYYQLAKLYHPDVNKQQNAHQKFSEITKAYQILIQKNSSGNNQQMQQQQKKQQKRNNPFRQSSQKRTKTQFEEDWTQFDSYDEYFKSKLKFKKAKRGQDIYVNLTITLSQSFQGAKKTISFTRKQNCSSCSKQQPQICISCGGKGQIFHRKNKQKIQCTNCDGFGYQLKCNSCYGTRYVNRDVTEQFYIEKGTHDKSILRVKNNGHQGYRHVNGDLYVTINVQQSQKMKIDGNNIHTQMELEYLVAIFGGQIEVQTLQGKKIVKVPHGTQSGQQLRLFNYGIKSPYSKQCGDHIIKFKIKIPQKLTSQQKRLMNQLSILEQN